MTVTVDPWGTTKVEPALTSGGTDTVMVGLAPTGVVSVTVLALPEHLVQTVEVDVNVTVETVLVVTTVEDPPVVIVLVTGQVVTVV